MAAIAAQALKGEHVEWAWEFFRLRYFPGWPHEDVAAALGLWSTRRGIKVSFEKRMVRNLEVIFVCFNLRNADGGPDHSAPTQGA